MTVSNDPDVAVIGYCIQDDLDGRPFLGTWSIADQQNGDIEPSNFFPPDSRHAARREVDRLCAIHDRLRQQLDYACGQLVEMYHLVPGAPRRTAPDWSTYFRRWAGGFRMVLDHLEPAGPMWKVTMGPVGRRESPVNGESNDLALVLHGMFAELHDPVLPYDPRLRMAIVGPDLEVACARLASTGGAVGRAHDKDGWLAYFGQLRGFWLEFLDGDYSATVIVDGEVFAASVGNTPEDVLSRLFVALNGPCYADGHVAKVGDYVTGTMEFRNPRTEITLRDFQLAGIVTSIGSDRDPMAIAVTFARRMDFAKSVGERVMATPPDKVLDFGDESEPMPYVVLDERRAVVRSNGLFVARGGPRPFMVITDTMWAHADRFKWHSQGDTG